MLEILQYIFSDFWIFCGTIILLYVIGIYFVITPMVLVIESILNKGEKKK